MVTINITIGELFDRLSILEVKREKIKNILKLETVETEYAMLQSKLHVPSLSLSTNEENEKLWQICDALFLVNLTLWNIEDELRAYESIGRFDDGFVRAARQVYKLNDKRYSLKCEINDLFGERSIEVKEHPDYEK